MQTCIICRLQKERFNDEHVIPDSIQGYYHIYSVCTDCNSRLGTNIDSTLTNHKLIEFQRFVLGIKGKSGKIPNPLNAQYTISGEPGHKVRLELNKQGEFIPRLIPIITEVKRDNLLESLIIRLDKKDEAKLPDIMSKVYKRLGVDAADVKTEVTRGEVQPWLETKIEIDTHKFKMALLKIAYEFAVDNIPTYFEDDQAKVISNILFESDFSNLTKEVVFVGDGFNNEILKPFESYIDFDNKNHYLILSSSRNGLVCFIKLFNTFSIGIKLSDKKHFLEDDLLIGKNDIKKREFSKFNTTQLLDAIFTPSAYRFRYHFITQEAADAFHKLEQQTDFDYVYLDGVMQFFDKHGNIAYNNIEAKLNQPGLKVIKKGDTINSMINEIVLNEELYIKHLPTKNLYRVLAVNIERFRHSKL